LIQQRVDTLANVMLSVLRALGRDDIERFGDSEGAFDLHS